RATPAIMVLSLVVLLGMPLLWALLRALRLDRAAADLALPIPLIGPVLHRNLIARWCDSMKLAIQAGMDLPAAVQLSVDLVGSPALKRDGKKIVEQLNAGREIDQMRGRLAVIPMTVLAVVQLSADRNDLPASLETIAAMYQQQAEMRL